MVVLLLPLNLSVGLIVSDITHNMLFVVLVVTVVAPAVTLPLYRLLDDKYRKIYPTKCPKHTRNP